MPASASAASFAAVSPINPPFPWVLSRPAAVPVSPWVGTASWPLPESDALAATAFPPVALSTAGSSPSSPWACPSPEDVSSVRIWAISFIDMGTRVSKANSGFWDVTSKIREALPTVISYFSASALSWTSSVSNSPPCSVGLFISAVCVWGCAPLFWASHKTPAPNKNAATATAAMGKICVFFSLVACSFSAIIYCSFLLLHNVFLPEYYIASDESSAILFFFVSLDLPTHCPHSYTLFGKCKILRGQ
ncbi:hypothetical protein IMSAGC019_00221 [Lachnospiraceae bacterium]|nr:hypothetical protein IMSAGC019_00221 [Lachnospiraceae bacterium]